MGLVSWMRRRKAARELADAYERGDEEKAGRVIAAHVAAARPPGPVSRTGWCPDLPGEDLGAHGVRLNP
jgi:hypothetical protein